ncbi:MAG: B12-binding domain-containing radical SAM protein, partial [Minisyncoccota bacterium]
MTIDRVVLIEPKAPGVHVFSRFALPRLGLPILGAVLRERFRIEPTIYYQQTSRIDWKVVAESDLVGISSITSTAPEAYRLIRKIKTLGNIPVVLGGVHSTFVPDEGLDEGADYVVRGEGEETLVQLVSHLNGNGPELAEIAGLTYREGETTVHNPDRPRVEDLSALPWPDLTLVRNFDKFRIVPVLTSRGCPFDCNFCSVTQMFGRRYRFRDNDDVMAELRSLYALHPKKTFFFYDDNFTANRERTKDLMERMLAEG